MLYRASREALPLFAIYALLFADHGLSTSQISVLLAVWSASSFLLEVPSGAWADLLDRRLLLIVSGLVYAGAFATWVAWPSFVGFLIGFVLWSLSSALMSGTYEAYLFNELTAVGRQSRYGPVKARAESITVLLMAAAIALAAPLHSLGGYPLVGWVSVGTALVHTCLAVALVGLDEFFALILAEGWASVGLIAWILAGITLLEAVATWAASAVARLAGMAHAAIVAGGGLLLAAGAWFTGPWSYLAIALGYALATASYISGDIRLQHSITGTARATTASVAGLIAEVGFLVTLGLISVATLRFDLAPVASVLALAVTVLATVAAYHAPAAPNQSP